MPQASDELRNQMKEFFGDEIDDQGPTRFLLENNWKMVGNGWWEVPTGETLETVSEKEWLCLKFLVHEWDHALRTKENSKCSF